MLNGTKNYTLVVCNEGLRGNRHYIYAMEQFLTDCRIFSDKFQELMIRYGENIFYHRCVMDGRKKSLNRSYY